MTEFENLKKNYAQVIQIGLVSNIGYDAAKQGNELLHKFCENLVENSRYRTEEKAAMKSELELLKEALSKEIDHYYNRRG